MKLVQPRTAIVEVVPLSGETDSGILIFDHDSAKDNAGRPISLLHRVLEVHPTCRYIKVGDVVGLANPHAVSPIEFEGQKYLIVQEDNVEYTIDGYDEKAEELAS
jgi:co-chaperonin GroES (HSP10)